MADRPTDRKRLSQLADEGIRLAESGRIDEAVVRFQTALEIKSDEGSVRYNLGLAYMNKQDPARAIEEIKLALRFEPRYPDTYFALATLYKLLGPEWKARQCYLAYLEFTSRGEKAQVAVERLNQLSGADSFLDPAQWINAAHAKYDSYVERIADTGETLGIRITSEKPDETGKIAKGLRSYFRHIAPQKAQQWAARHFLAGSDLVEARMYRAAIVQFIESIELYPHDQLAMASLAEAHALAQDQSLAARLAELIDVSQEDPELRADLNALIRKLRAQTRHG